MSALVLYDSKFGNTERIARAIGRVLEAEFTVQVQSIAEQPTIPSDLDLLAVGGPTHAHGLSQPMHAFLEGLPNNVLGDIPVLAFDTRFRLHPLLSGRAAPKIARWLRRQGANLLVPPESFFVVRSEGHPLEPGEEERAAAWTRQALACRAAVT